MDDQKVLLQMTSTQVQEDGQQAVMELTTAATLHKTKDAAVLEYEETGDSGLTGRKIIVDTYGGYGRHGGGAFSGKDPTKVDRSAAYAARWVAKNVVAAGLAEQCEVQLAYAIGVAEPVSIRVDTFGTGAADEAAIEAAVEQVFDLRPASIIEQLGLRRPIYRQLAAYGHMGREELGVAWEQTDKAGALRAAMGL